MTHGDTARRPPKCHHHQGARVLSTHRKGCDTPGCEGCQPCQERHCTMPRCSRHLRDTEPKVCAKCVGTTREQLTRIGDLCKVAPVAALEARRLNSAPLDIAGPVPERDTYAARRIWALRGGMCGCPPGRCPDQEPVVPEGPACRKADACAHQVCRYRTFRPTCPALIDWLDNVDGDLRHPLWVLRAWVWLAANDLGHISTGNATVASAVRYLDANLTDLSRHEDFGFDDLAREIAECKDHVEQVLLVAQHVEKGAACPECDRAGRKARPLELHYSDSDTTGGADTWQCPTCENTWTQDQYDKYVEREHLARAPRLTASQIHEQYRVPEGTLRRWANGWKDSRTGEPRPAIVRKRGKDQHGRQLYDVTDVIAAREQKEQIGA